jgi:hypothetical protein
MPIRSLVANDLAPQGEPRPISNSSEPAASIQPNNRRRRRAQDLLAFSAYVAGFIALVGWFKAFDLYHTHFEASGALIAFYNLCRILFVFYLFWIVQAVGSFSLRLIAGAAWNSIAFLDRLALGFFAGTGIWHVVLLTLGYLNLYTVPTASIVALPIVALSYRDVRATLDSARQSIAMQRGRPWTRLRLLRVLLAIVCLATSCALVLVKGLYPAGGHDYFTHYFYYYQSVIDRAGLWPNEVWYHYYYSKGAGLFFLGILLTDPLAPQLVTLCFFAASALVLFQLLGRISQNTIWPWVGTILYLCLYIYTPGQREYLGNGGWGDFEKLHELNTALVISVFWSVAGVFDQPAKLAATWASAAISAAVAAIIINPTIAPYIVSTLGLLGIWFVVSRHLVSGFICIGLASVAGATLLTVFAINYLSTGLISDQGILIFWQFSDLEELYRWGALPLAIILHWDRTGMDANSVPLSFDTLRFLALALRFDLLFPLLGLGLASAIAAVRTRRIYIPAPKDFLLLTIALIVFVVLCLAAGRSQPISFYRYSSFVVPIAIAEGIALCAILEARGTVGLAMTARTALLPLAALVGCILFAFLIYLHGRLPTVVLIVGEGIALWTILEAPGSIRLGIAARTALLPLVALVGCIFAAYTTYLPGRFSAIAVNAWRFAAGAYSIDNAYADQDGWPGRLPWGAIYPGARGAYAVVGPHTPLWTFHIHTYCMMPDCRLEQNGAFVITRDLDRVLFGTPEEGMRILQAAGLNYFLFSRELPVNDWITLAPLLSPDNIGRFLGIRWTDGTTALLTWLGPDTVPLDPNWLADYRKAVAISPAVQGFPHTAMRRIFEQLRATPHPWRSYTLPREGSRPY